MCARCMARVRALRVMRRTARDARHTGRGARLGEFSWAFAAFLLLSSLFYWARWAVSGFGYCTVTKVLT